MMNKPKLRPFLALCCCAALVACAGTPAKQDLPLPAIITVDAWGGSAAAEPPRSAQRITHITLHHQGESWAEGKDVAAYLRRLQQWSRLSKRWADIPYHYVVAPDGRIYAARDPGTAGDTNTEYDPRGHALVMLLGNFEEIEPSVAQLRATAELMAALAQRHGLTAEQIASHKDYSAQTLCPGRHLYRHLQNGWLQDAVTARLAGRPLPEPVP
ncbi:peptidoglycan recognition family protein [Paucibacter sp. PLA-PC-4]|nr:peptidoglycan recognition family protein [Paucibacter sp. PLA-PC-4]